MSGKRSVYITVALALAAVLLVGVNVVSNSLLRTARVDLTADKLYTLSAGTETILGELEEPILIRFFYSRDLANDYPTVRDYAKRVREILEEYVIAWFLVTAIAITLTFPVWLTVNYLGNPDNGVILAAYVGSLLMAGAFLAIGNCMSAVTKNQVIAFVVAVVACFMFTVSGLPFVIDFFRGWAPQAIVDAVSAFSFLTNFDSMSKGVIDLRSVVYFGTLIVFWLFATVLLVDRRKSV